MGNNHTDLSESVRSIYIDVLKNAKRRACIKVNEATGVCKGRSVLETATGNTF